MCAGRITDQGTTDGYYPVMIPDHLIDRLLEDEMQRIKSDPNIPDSSRFPVRLAAPKEMAKLKAKLERTLYMAIGEEAHAAAEAACNDRERCAGNALCSLAKFDHKILGLANCVRHFDFLPKGSTAVYPEGWTDNWIDSWCQYVWEYDASCAC